LFYYIWFIRKGCPKGGLCFFWVLIITIFSPVILNIVKNYFLSVAKNLLRHGIQATGMAKICQSKKILFKHDRKKILLPVMLERSEASSSPCM